MAAAAVSLAQSSISTTALEQLVGLITSASITSPYAIWPASLEYTTEQQNAVGAASPAAFAPTSHNEVVEYLVPARFLVREHELFNKSHPGFA